MTISYVPVVLNDEIIGYLTVEESDTSLYFMRRLGAEQDTLLPTVRWTGRWDEVEASGEDPVEFMRRWIGGPEDAEAGGVPAGTEVQQAADDEAFREFVNPGYLAQKRLKAEAEAAAEAEAEAERKLRMGRYGSLEDPFREWDDLSPFTLEKTGYEFMTDSPIRYLAVTLGGDALGYLWASETDDAADYLPRPDGGAVGLDAGYVWGPRLNRAHEEGLTPMELLLRWKGEPEHPEGGGILPHAEVRPAPSVDALEFIADSPNYEN